MSHWIDLESMVCTAEPYSCYGFVLVHIIFWWNRYHTRSGLYISNTIFEGRFNLFKALLPASFLVLVEVIYGRLNFCTAALLSILINDLIKDVWRRYVHSESTKQMEEKLNFQVPAEGLELVILLHSQY